MKETHRGRSFAITEEERGAAEAALFKTDLGDSSIRNSATGNGGYSFVMLLLRSVQKTSYCSKSWTAKEVQVRVRSQLEGVARSGDYSMLLITRICERHHR